MGGSLGSPSCWGPATGREQIGIPASLLSRYINNGSMAMANQFIELGQPWAKVSRRVLTVLPGMFLITDIVIQFLCKFVSLLITTSEITFFRNTENIQEE